MPTDWIAVVGSVASNRTQELSLTNIETAQSAATQIGKALAERGYGLLVYSSEEIFVESAVVEGYLESEKAQPGSIRVIYPRDRKTNVVPSFPKYKERANCFSLELDKNPRWETSFYLSLQNCSGVLLIGGGRSTYVAGIVSKILQKPVLALDTFGGAASEIWAMISAEEDFITEAERRTLAASGDMTWALAVVDILAAAKKSRLEARANRDVQVERSRMVLNSQAVLALLVFVMSVVLIVLTWDNGNLSRMELLSCLVASPLLAGFSGAFIRKVADIFQGDVSNPSRNSPLVLGILGAIAGGFSGLLFLMPQLTATTPESSSHALPVQVTRLVPFAMITGFLAGFTANLVYEKLREAKALDGSSVEGLLKGLNQQPR